MSAYNSEPKQKPEEKEHSSGCLANGCPLPGSLNIANEGWFCPYHSTKGRHVWDEITKIVIKTARCDRLIKVIESITCQQFNSLQELAKCKFKKIPNHNRWLSIEFSDPWKVKKSMKPYHGEWHKSWVLRVKGSIHDYRKKLVAEIIKKPQKSFDGMEGKEQKSSWAVDALTNGSLLK